MEVTERKLSELIPYENNPRKNDEAVDAVAESLREFGWKQPIVIDRDGVIIAGHTRWKAAKRLGMETAPVVLADDLTEEQVRAYRLADNKTAELARWDFGKLDAELLGIEDLDMSLFGFDVDPGPVDPEDTQEGRISDEVEARVERGDLWVLGEHRLMCGDSTSKADLDALMNGEKAKFVFTDPPYGVSIGSKNKMINAVEPGRGGSLRLTSKTTRKAPTNCTRFSSGLFLI